MTGRFKVLERQPLGGRSGVAVRLIDRQRFKLNLQLELVGCWIGVNWMRTEIARHWMFAPLPFVVFHATVLRSRP